MGSLKATPWAMTGAVSGRAGCADPHPATVRAAATASPAATLRSFLMPIRRTVSRLGCIRGRTVIPARAGPRDAGPRCSVPGYGLETAGVVPAGAALAGASGSVLLVVADRGGVARVGVAGPVEVLQLARQRPWGAGADRLAVDDCHRHDPAGRGGDQHLGRQVQVIDGQLALL